MALPVGTQRLGLQNVEASTKSVVLVKLTDSALGAIAQFLRQRVRFKKVLFYFKFYIFNAILSLIFEDKEFIISNYI